MCKPVRLLTQAFWIKSVITDWCLKLQYSIENSVPMIVLRSKVNCDLGVEEVRITKTTPTPAHVIAFANTSPAMIAKAGNGSLRRMGAWA